MICKVQKSTSYSCLGPTYKRNSPLGHRRHKTVRSSVCPVVWPNGTFELPQIIFNKRCLILKDKLWVVISLCLPFLFQEIIMDGPIFLTSILECPAITLGPSPMYAVSTCFLFLNCIFKDVLGLIYAHLYIYNLFYYS